MSVSISYYDMFLSVTLLKLFMNYDCGNLTVIICCAEGQHVGSLRFKIFN